MEPIRGMVGVGTWATQAEFKDIKVTKGNQTLFASDFSKGLTGWKTIRGQWQVVEGVLRQTSNQEDARALFGDPTWSDYTLNLKARKLSGNEGFLILFGVPDENTKSWWNLGGWGNTRHSLEAPGVRAEQMTGRLETSRWYDIRIELKGNTIRAFLDNQLLHTATAAPSIHTLVFSTQASGEKKAISQWGLDTSWASPENMTRGVAFMGKDQVDMVRVAFPIDNPLVNGELTAAGKEEVDKRARIAMMAGDKPWTMMPHQEGGVHSWFKNGNEVITERWVEAMKAAQRRYGKKLVSVEPFNEPDYGWNQGTVGNLNDILGALRNSPDFSGVQMSGPSTLNADAWMPWYRVIKNRLDRATTHNLSGSMESYINFHRTALADGKVVENPEVHNLAEVIVGAEYGLQSAIWWASAELARGEFVKAVQGQRLAYAEDRLRWSAAAVYRAPGGKVQAFLGSSERQGQNTTYRFVSRDRPVFFNGDGPRREFTVPIRKDTEFLVNITWGEDVPHKIEGKYFIVNRHSGKALGVAGATNNTGGANIQQMAHNRGENQQWEIAPIAMRYGDQSFFTIGNVRSGKAFDTAYWPIEASDRARQWPTGENFAQQWFFEYAGNNNFYIRSRWSAKYLEIAGGNQSANASLQQSSRTGAPQQLWRLIPVSASNVSSLDFVAPQRPRGLKASAKRLAVTLQWVSNRDSDLASYTVLRSMTAAGPYDTIARGVTGNTFTDNEANDQRKYFYKVKAVDRSLNQSALSGQVSAIPAGPTLP